MKLSFEIKILDKPPQPLNHFLLTIHNLITQ